MIRSEDRMLCERAHNTGALNNPPPTKPSQISLVIASGNLALHGFLHSTGPALIYTDLPLSGTAYTHTYTIVHSTAIHTIYPQSLPVIQPFSGANAKGHSLN